jgi:DNA invertase Pin-like site-specific DNA recombinase
MVNVAKVGYARISTHGQNDDSQLDELNAAGCEKTFTDVATGKLAQRPELDACLAYLRAGDTLVITRLSRAMRNLREMIDLAHQLEQRGINLIVLKQAIDTTTPTGRLTFHIMAAIDEWQRELIVEGTREGLAAARARGRVGGRKPKLSADQITVARQLYDAREHTVEQIAAMFGVSRHTIYRALEKAST